MPLAIAASSSPPVQTSWPFLPMTMAVPVSWHIGSTPPAEMLAFFSSSSATYLSLAEASGSSRIARSCGEVARAAAGGRCRWKACGGEQRQRLGLHRQHVAAAELVVPTKSALSLR